MPVYISIPNKTIAQEQSANYSINQEIGFISSFPHHLRQ